MNGQLVYIPFLLFLIVFITFVVATKSEFSFKDALTENEAPKKTIVNPQYNAATIAANSTVSNLYTLFPPTIEVSNLPPSVYELSQLLQGREESKKALENEIEKANSNIDTLNKKLADANTALQTIEANKPSDDLLTNAQAALATAQENPTDQNAITTAQTNLTAAENSINEFNNNLASAQNAVRSATDAVNNSSSSIAKLNASVLQVMPEIETAKQNLLEQARQKMTPPLQFFPTAQVSAVILL